MDISECGVTARNRPVPQSLVIPDDRLHFCNQYRGDEMAIDLPLENMTLADKLEAMEVLWADISRRPADLPSPDWHREILEQRRRLVAEGKLKFLDWDTAIADLRRELRGNKTT